MNTEAITEKSKYLLPDAAMRVVRRDSTWIIWSCGLPLVECDSEAEAWSVLAAMCLAKASAK